MNSNELFGSISQVLSKFGLGFNSDHRAIKITLADADLTQNLFLQSIQGHSAINEGLTAELLCLSTDAFIPLKQFIGQTACIEQITDLGQSHYITGIISHAVSGHSDGGFAIYRLTLQDSASALWSKRRNSRVFMEKTILDITNILFSEWQQKSPLFAKSISLNTSKLSKESDTRPFIMQSNEDDFQFLTRLWRSEGINWFIDVDPSDPQKQQLVLFDDSKSLSQLPAGTIRFHRSDATEQRDSITALNAVRQLQGSEIHVQRWNQSHGDMQQHVQPSNHQQSQAYNAASLSLEQAWHSGPAALGDLAGGDRNTQPTQQQVARLGEILLQRQELESKCFQASSSVRDAKIGYWFELSEHPELDQHGEDERQFLITDLSFYAKNNLPKELDQRVNSLIEHSGFNKAVYDTSLDASANQSRMTLVRRSIPIVPYYDPQQHIGTAQPQRARVVGTQGERVHVDAWGRIKVRFLFARPQDNTHSGGSGSSDSASDSAWVDVLTPWAGDGDNSYGARFLPRVGELVAIGFFDGNADRPFVMGRIHEGQRTPTQFDHVGKLPDTRYLNGIKSQEIGGNDYNQLRFDDTPQQVSAQLASSHATSQLNLGNLTHPRSKEDGEIRGEGFELRTDKFGAVRAAKGLLISSYEQPQAKQQQLNVAETEDQLKAALERMTRLDTVAKKQQANGLDILENLQGFIDNLGSDNPEKAQQFKQALMLLASPDGIALTTPQDIYSHADQNITQASGQSHNITATDNFNLQVGKKLSLFAAEQGAKLFAGKGKVEIQAQGDGLDAIARKKLSITSTEDSIQISAAKEITINVQGSQIKIDGSGITVTTPKVLKLKAGQIQTLGGGSVNINMPQIPRVEMPKSELEFRRVYADGSPMPNIAFTAHMPDGTTQKGTTDADGLARFDGVPDGRVAVEYEADRNPVESMVNMEFLTDEINKLLSYGQGLVLPLADGEADSSLVDSVKESSNTNQIKTGK